MKAVSSNSRTLFARSFMRPNPPNARRKLFKADHPRAIDWYIDYFGGRPTADVSPENDPCGEGFLDALAGRAEPAHISQSISERSRRRKGDD